MPPRRRVALIVETSSGYGRALLRGIMRFIRSHEEWSVFLEQRALTSDVPSWLNQWHGDGVITRSMTPWLTESMARNGVPLVNLVDRQLEVVAPAFSSDQVRIGRVAAEHLIERGFRRFGFCGYSAEAWSAGRREGFVSRLREVSVPVEVYESAWLGPEVRAWDIEQQSLCDWLRSLKTPSGVMACNDLRAQQLLDACQLCGISVPEEIAVVGVDNDELLCQLCNPPLSSVIPDTENIGFMAAEALSRMMAREFVPNHVVRVPPIGVATRQSTDSMAIGDANIAAAVRFIRERACNGTTVEEVLDHLPMSRSALERGFRKYLNRSPQQEIRNVQLKRCRTLLEETDLPMERIAALCGFRHPEYMHVVFKRELGMTPGQYRRAPRARSVDQP